MPVNLALAARSNDLLTVAVVLYGLALLGYAGEYAFGRPERPAQNRGRSARAVPAPAARPVVATVPAPAARVPVGVGAGTGVPERAARPTASSGARPPARPSPGATAPVRRAGGRAGQPGDPASGVGAVAVTLTVVAWAAHLGAVVLRGLSVDHPPWGNMYEFTIAGALAATTAYVVLLAREGSKARGFGLPVTFVVVCMLGLAGTVLYTQAGPLVPALHSGWLAIHVTAAVVSSGILTVGSAAAVLYLVSLRYYDRLAAGRRIGLSGLGRRLPEPAVLERTAYRSIAFAFPIWTFAIIAGAIWAESAWGRYWGWDPKETWAFITWVIYACYLHARSTAGWRGRRAAWLAILGMAAFTFNFFGVNIFITGLHSYAGLGN